MAEVLLSRLDKLEKRHQESKQATAAQTSKDLPNSTSVARQVKLEVDTPPRAPQPRLQTRPKMSLETSSLARVLLGYDIPGQDKTTQRKPVIPGSRTSANHFQELQCQVALDLTDRRLPGIPRMLPDFIPTEGRAAVLEQLPNDQFASFPIRQPATNKPQSDVLCLIERQGRQALASAQAVQFYTEALYRLLRQLHPLCVTQKLVDMHNKACALVEAQNSSVVETLNNMVSCVWPPPL